MLKRLRKRRSKTKSLTMDSIFSEGAKPFC